MLLPHIQNTTLLDSTPGNPNGYITKDGMWAAIPLMGSKKFIVVYNGKQIHTAQNYNSAKKYILKESKKRNQK